ncbi:VOC family protein [Brevibacillus choshinensis]|uniref:Bleomycin resistance protein n=1 Tax=Brevibacillus choshinensis TaxID=54911 RepID=A0ABX7FLS9_BRECH|nr:VOC family protein [Brevibacillus choshinensis]QRG66605.1 bleomycin resistance protein [Brevibacillus choshinensis]
MIIRRLVLQTSMLMEMKSFYTKVLLCPLREEKADSFTVAVGETLLTFQGIAGHKPFYHFAFGISEHAFDGCFRRLKEQGCILVNAAGIEVDTSYIWKGKQLYFEDPEGNIGEVLAFSGVSDAKWLSVQEMGLPVGDVSEAATLLASIPNEYAQESDSFHFYGDPQGVFVLVREQRPWYPTDRGATIHPVLIEVEGAAGDVLQLPGLPYQIIR